MGRKKKSKLNKNRLYLMVKDPEDPINDFTWATVEQIQHCKELGYKRLKENENAKEV